MAYKIYAKARKQMESIWGYTYESWGIDQAEKYISELYTAIEAIQEKPKLWRSLEDEEFANLKFFRYRRHYIFFRILSDKSIAVTDILHDSMNIPAQLRRKS